MKKAILVTLTAAVLAWTAALAQQFSLQTNLVTSIPAIVWRGTNAQVIARQLLSLTNADGRLVIPPGLLTNRSGSILFRVDTGTNGLQSIRARMQ